MRLPRSTTLAVTVALLSGLVAIGGAAAQTAITPAPPQPADAPIVAELAQTIARALQGTPKTPRPLLTFVSATAHDNVVEVRFAASDPERFAVAKVNPEMQRTFMAHIFCRDDPNTPLNRGVVIHQIIISPDGHDQIEFTVDRAACAALAPTPKPADAKTLAATAQAVAQDIEADEHSPVPKTPRKKTSLRLDTAAAHGGVVEVHVLVADAKSGEGFKRNQSLLTYLFRKYYCMKYGDAMKQGVSVHPTLTKDDGTALLDFTIKQSSCEDPD
jgi:hypothetical protein